MIVMNPNPFSIGLFNNPSIYKYIVRSPKGEIKTPLNDAVAKFFEKID